MTTSHANASHAVSRATAAQRAASGEAPSWRSRLLASPGLAVAVIWLCSALAALAAPDMMTGSQHEHFPIVGITIWFWTLAATGFVLLAARRAGMTLTLGACGVWLAVLLVTVLAPVMETGSDPTRIPLVALFAPVAGALATGFLAVHQAASD